MKGRDRWNEANSGENFDKILARKLDRVRVVGRAEPVQLWNILGFREELPENVLEAAEIFKSAMELYLKKDFVKAGKLFIKANKLVPEDETPLVYAQRCKEYLENGLSENWGLIKKTTSACGASTLNNGSIIILSEIKDTSTAANCGAFSNKSGVM